MIKTYEEIILDNSTNCNDPCLAMLSSCSGNSDETENGGTDDGILRITADKTAIQADGVEK